MTDKKRITRILGAIEKHWKKNPEQRFFQLLINMGLLPNNAVFWELEDDRVEEHIRGLTTLSDTTQKTTKKKK